MAKTFELWQVSLPYATFGAVVQGGDGRNSGMVIKAAPIGSWAIGKKIDALARYAQKRGGCVECIATEIEA